MQRHCIFPVRKFITTLQAHIQTFSGENELVVIAGLFSWFFVYEAVDFMTCDSALIFTRAARDAYTAVRSAAGQQEVTQAHFRFAKKYIQRMFGVNCVLFFNG